MMKIQNHTLDTWAIGARVKYLPPHVGSPDHPHCQEGTISSWNSTYVFVRYSTGDTAAATPPHQLVWVDDPVALKTQSKNTATDE